jgi:predicted Rossmann fold nucleotide-binding protein DprA/Smf involved in DNA uptake
LQRLLRTEERSLDELLNETGENAADILAALSMLELSGAIESRPGGRYTTRR